MVAGADRDVTPGEPVPCTLRLALVMQTNRIVTTPREGRGQNSGSGPVGDLGGSVAAVVAEVARIPSYLIQGRRLGNSAPLLLDCTGKRASE